MTNKDKDMETAENRIEEENLPPTPNESETTQLTIGEYLQEKREAREYSLKKISHQTKISTSLLELLEENKLEELPNKAYVRGFIKSLSSVLAFDQNEALEVLDYTYELIKPDAKRLKVDVLKEAEIEPGQSPLILVSAVMVFAFIGIAAFFYNNATDTKEKVVKTQVLNSDAPLKKPSESFKVESAASEETAVQNIQEEEVEKASAEVVDSEEKPEEVEIKVKEASPIQEVVEDESPVEETIPQKQELVEKEEEAESNDRKTDLRPLPSELYAIDKEGTSEALEEFVPQSMQNSVISGKQNLFITAVDGDSWITYKKDNDPVKKFTLTKGKNLLIRGDVIRVFMGNVKAAKVFLNNELLDISTRSGVKSLVFPETEAPKYSLPLFIFKKSGEVVPSDEYDPEDDV